MQSNKMIYVDHPIFTDMNTLYRTYLQYLAGCSVEVLTPACPPPRSIKSGDEINNRVYITYRKCFMYGVYVTLI